MFNNCPLCESPEALELGSLRLGETHVRCVDCGTIYTIETTDYDEAEHGLEWDYDEDPS